MANLLRDISRRLRLVITRALVKSVDDSTAIQLLKLKILDSEVFNSIERLQSYGFTSNPPLDSETVVAEIAGSRDNLIALVVDSAANRIKDLLLGETCFYSLHGQTITLKKDGKTYFNNGIDYAVQYTALKSAFDELKADYNDLKTKYNAHIHTTTATVGASTTVGIIASVITALKGSTSTADMSGAKEENIRLP